MSVTIIVRGPIFTNAPDLVKTALHRMVQELVELGEQHLDTMLWPRPRGVYLSVAEAQKGHYSQGDYRRGIHGEVKEFLGRIDDAKVIYGPWLEGTGSRNQTTRFKGYASFRRTAQWMQEKAPRVARAHALKLVRDLGG